MAAAVTGAGTGTERPKVDETKSDAAQTDAAQTEAPKAGATTAGQQPVARPGADAPVADRTSTDQPGADRADALDLTAAVRPQVAVVLLLVVLVGATYLAGRRLRSLRLTFAG